MMKEVDMDITNNKVCKHCGNNRFEVKAMFSEKFILDSAGQIVEDVKNSIEGFDVCSKYQCTKCGNEHDAIHEFFECYVPTHKEENESMKRRYLNSKGLYCPICGSEELGVLDVKSDSDYVKRDIQCDDCDFPFTETYTLSNVDFE